jgi:hypothetical protein
MDPRVTELHCIMPIGNVPSVMTHGLLSYERAAKLSHASVAMAEVQERRDTKQVPNGLRLHQYANLYFHARNPMLFKRKDQAATLCVLCVSVAVLDMPGVVITEQNAASDYARFLAPSQAAQAIQAGILDFDAIFARDWTHADRITYLRRKARKCAEVLVPHGVPWSMIQDARVVDATAAATLRGCGFDRPVIIDPDLFFH